MVKQNARTQKFIQGKINTCIKNWHLPPKTRCILPKDLEPDIYRKGVFEKLASISAVCPQQETAFAVLRLHRDARVAQAIRDGLDHTSTLERADVLAAWGSLRHSVGMYCKSLIRLLLC